MITGSFTFERVSGALERGGGACLLADLHNRHPCSIASDCTAAFGPPPVGGLHYCIAVDGGPDKTCWTRPSGGGCIRSNTYDPADNTLAPGTYVLPAVAVRVNGKIVPWITTPCMAITSNAAGCGNRDPSQSVKAYSFLLGDEQ